MGNSLTLTGKNGKIKDLPVGVQFRGHRFSALSLPTHV